jgi:molybdopterin synthase catalytic subunit
MAARRQSSDYAEPMANPVCNVLLTQKPLVPGSGNELGCGAVVDFSGVVREMEAGCPLEGIDYEAHPAMAEHQLLSIAGAAVEKFSLRRVELQHRVGFVPVGEASLFLRVASPHRQEAFAASVWIVDELKRKVPIWKRPRYRHASVSLAGGAAAESSPAPAAIAR